MVGSVTSNLFSLRMRYLETMVLLLSLSSLFGDDVECDGPNQIYYDPLKPGGECLLGCKAGKKFKEAETSLKPLDD